MSVKSAVRVLEIFELLAGHPNGLTVKEISEALSFPQSSTFHLVQTLFSNDYISQTIMKRYKLGPKLIQLGTRASDSLDLHSDAQPHLEKLMNEVQETVFMAVLSGEEIVYVSKFDNYRSIRTSAQIGSRKPLYCTGLGKAFLTFLPGKERKQLLEHAELKAVTAKTITDRSVLEEQLKQFAKNGYAIDDEESEEGLFCLSAPIFNAAGRMTAAISVAGPKERITSRKQEIVHHLLHAAASVSRSIGYNRPS
ncbi:IclR family transcriptional regulator [Aneurinibacillus terranovensis]|uniref:IclR family transcriptional regulator n=1 Tax=Aneurinibacillus terranovensis TaxID=278991 RepID=UPI00041ABE85|nr:IclR family transcriptional regulator [Aneurinibacillus terranovensis]